MNETNNIDLTEFSDNFHCVITDHPKWYHLFQYSKKGRTQKKYCNLIMNKTLRMMKGKKHRR